MKDQKVTASIWISNPKDYLQDPDRVDVCVTSTDYHMEEVGWVPLRNVEIPCRAEDMPSVDKVRSALVLALRVKLEDMQAKNEKDENELKGQIQNLLAIGMDEKPVPEMEPVPVEDLDLEPAVSADQEKWEELRDSGDVKCIKTGLQLIFLTRNNAPDYKTYGDLFWDKARSVFVYNAVKTSEGALQKFALGADDQRPDLHAQIELEAFQYYTSNVLLLGAADLYLSEPFRAFLRSWEPELAKELHL